MGDRAKSVIVSFSKRRTGLFRKASELCTKCDAQVAVLVLSPAGNPFAFGHPSVDQLLRRASILGAGVEIGDAIDGERQRSKAREVEWLRARVKMRKKDEAFEAWVERKIEACETVEKLEALKLECLALRDKIARKLSDNDESFLGSGHDGDDVVLDDSSGGVRNDTTFPFDGTPGGDGALCGVRNDTSFSFDGTHGCDDVSTGGVRNDKLVSFDGTRGCDNVLMGGVRNDSSFPFDGARGCDGTMGGIRNDTSFPSDGTRGCDDDVLLGGVRNDKSFSFDGTRGCDDVLTGGVRNDTSFPLDGTRVYHDFLAGFQDDKLLSFDGTHGCDDVLTGGVPNDTSFPFDETHVYDDFLACFEDDSSFPLDGTHDYVTGVQDDSSFPFDGTHGYVAGVQDDSSFLDCEKGFGFDFDDGDDFSRLFDDEELRLFL